ncbi:nuclear factor of activated T-cells 5 isoform X2 [Onthophagus taurus]|uniref:nuclear factor of activated T-cells 5 isoform X2 n=1 Tax=Onthophagus taurus TaxID=166361 RepID=UPI0039BDB23A
MGPKKTSKPTVPNKKTVRPSKSTKTGSNGTKKAEQESDPEKPSTSKDGNSMKMTMCTAPTMVPRTPAKRPGRPPSGKRLAMTRNLPGKIRATVRRSLDPCDNSNDSGLGFDNHFDPYAMGMQERMHCPDERLQPKRSRLDVKIEDEINDSYSFPDHVSACETQNNSTTLIRTAPTSSVSSLSISASQTSTSTHTTSRSASLVSHSAQSGTPVTLATQLSHTSKYGDISLSIICQPEQQHRARYQTEGSRGAVKDRTGNGFPMVKLNGYNKPVTLQVFIGSDTGKVTPHMFYQACRVSGKNSTPCTEKKIEGTIVIELLMNPAKEMTATCDCVGILKERNVDVEHRFPDQQGPRSKKKSTRCRMVFRATITHNDGVQETLQVCSQPIVCTQPPGIPEICKKSLTSCPATGGLELFALGKNFSKDTKVYFQLMENDHVRWEQSVAPDKEYLQQMHFVCVIPPYMHPNITEPVTVRLFVVSSGKTSEPQHFVYTPVNGAVPSVRVDSQATSTPTTSSAPFLSKMMWSSLTKQEQDVDMMPPPGTNMVPLAQRRSSTNTNTDSNSPPLRGLKQELLDENTQSSIMDPSELRSSRYRHISESSLDVHPGDSNLSMINENSNISLVNENSVEMIVRRNSMSRPVTVCDSSLDVNVSNSNLSSLNDESSCSVHLQDNRIFNQGLLTTVHSDISNASVEDLKVMDLRKISMATVADLANTSAPSLATLQSFGVTEASSAPLPTQSGLSVESYLTTLENKNRLVQSMFGQKVNEVIVTGIMSPSQNISRLGAVEPAFVQNQRPIVNAHQSDVLSIVAKSEAAAIAEKMAEQLPITTTVPSMPPALDNAILTSAITTDKLDALVNCAVETHINNSKMIRNTSPQQNLMLGNQDVLLNSQNSLMVSPIINTALTTPTTLQQAISQSPNISPEVILNSQVSPSLMCRSSNIIQDTLLSTTAFSATTVDNPIIQQQNLTNILSPVNQPTTQQSHMSPEHLHAISPIQRTIETEKDILLNATADLLATQKKIAFGNILHLPDGINNNNNIQTNSLIQDSALQTIVTEASFVGNQFPSTVTTQPETLTSSSEIDKRNEDRMIPPSFPSMSDNDLINIINPTCFDQGNNFH